MHRLFFVLVAAFIGLGFGNKPEHSSVEVTSTKKGEALEFTFKVIAAPGIKVTLEAPWKLALKQSDGLAFAATDFNKAAMDDKLPGYVVATSAAPGKDAGKLTYALTTFVCTDNKSQCFREVHNGEVDWQK